MFRFLVPAGEASCSPGGVFLFPRLFWGGSPFFPGGGPLFLKIATDYAPNLFGFLLFFFYAELLIYSFFLFVVVFETDLPPGVFFPPGEKQPGINHLFPCPYQTLFFFPRGFTFSPGEVGFFSVGGSGFVFPSISARNLSNEKKRGVLWRLHGTYFH